MDADSILKELDGASLLKTLKQYELVDTTSPTFDIEPILSESINRNFKVSDGQQTLLLKIFNTRNALPINRNKVFNMQEELAILGLAPVPLFLNEDNTIYCEQWIEFPGHEKGDDVKLLAESLYNVHNSFVSAPLLSLSEHWQNYWQKIENPSDALKQQYELVKKQWHDYVEVSRDEFVLCHNDLHADHLSYANGPLLDWEYAGLGCRYCDIASCCIINQLSHSEKLDLCSIYAELANQDASELLEKVRFASSLVNFTYELWGKSLGIVKNLQ